jgi:hypothetical protein
VSRLAACERGPRTHLRACADGPHPRPHTPLARGNIGLDVAPEKMALVQKQLISNCNLLGKPVLITRVVDSMVNNPRPTRAEATGARAAHMLPCTARHAAMHSALLLPAAACVPAHTWCAAPPAPACPAPRLRRATPPADIANAVLDGVDGILLGAETLRGDYPVEAVATIAQICRRVCRCVCVCVFVCVCVCVCVCRGGCRDGWAAGWCKQLQGAAASQVPRSLQPQVQHTPGVRSRAHRRPVYTVCFARTPTGWLRACLTRTATTTT